MVLAHQIEAMARQKNLKPIASYMKAKPDAGRGSGNADVIAMFDKLAKDGKGVRVRRVQRVGPDVS